jgi:hypothetical protein
MPGRPFRFIASFLSFFLTPHTPTTPPPPPPPPPPPLTIRPAVCVCARACAPTLRQGPKRPAVTHTHTAHLDRIPHKRHPQPQGTHSLPSPIPSCTRGRQVDDLNPWVYLQIRLNDPVRTTALAPQGGSRPGRPRRHLLRAGRHRPQSPTRCQILLFREENVRVRVGRRSGGMGRMCG